MLCKVYIKRLFQNFNNQLLNLFKNKIQHYQNI